MCFTITSSNSIGKKKKIFFVILNGVHPVQLNFTKVFVINFRHRMIILTDYPLFIFNLHKDFIQHKSDHHSCAVTRRHSESVVGTKKNTKKKEKHYRLIIGCELIIKRKEKESV